MVIIVKMLVMISTCNTRVRYAVLTPTTSILVLRYNRDLRLLKSNPATKYGNPPIAKVIPTVFTVFSIVAKITFPIYILEEIRNTTEVDIIPPMIINTNSRRERKDVPLDSLRNPLFNY